MPVARGDTCMHLWLRRATSISEVVRVNIEEVVELRGKKRI
jgi:hypothetical protein